MTDRENVIKKLYDMQLACAVYGDDEAIQTINDVIALLKEQEARVMTVEEINKRAESLDPDPVFVQWRETGGTAWVVRSVNIIAGMVNAGNRSVRVWTSRPTPEQMRKTKWEGAENANMR